MKILSLVLPCYNEGENINKLLDTVTKLQETNNNIEIIIVENGSKDDSLTKIKNHLIYKKNSITLLEIKKNLGYGHGIIEGLKKSTGKYIGWCHADLQNSLDDIYNIFKNNLNKLEENKLVLKGKRMNRNAIDNFFTSGMSKLVNLLFKCKLNDINAQPKIFSRNLLELLKNPPIDFSLDLYLLLTANQNNYKILECPLIVYKRVAGEAKGGGALMSKIKLTFRTFDYIYKIKKSGKF
tara:strand:+ start:516 stop:1229 length:714 start_codon:yes stop_codon:yes gene_type:complete